MAIVLEAKGELDKALEVYQQALDIKVKSHGEGHISTARTVNKLDEVFRKRGELDKAMEMYQQALTGA